MDLGSMTDKATGTKDVAVVCDESLCNFQQISKDMEIFPSLGYHVGHQFECFHCVYSFEGIKNLANEIPDASETYFDEYYKDIGRPSLAATDSFQHTDGS